VKFYLIPHGSDTIIKHGNTTKHRDIKLDG